MTGMLGPHAAFIVSSYVTALIIVAGVALWVGVDYRRQLRHLADLEKRGVARRSSRATTGAAS